MRAPRGPIQTRRHKRMRKLAKGMRKVRQSRFRLAKQAVFTMWLNAYKGRKLKKRNFRGLWIARLNAAAREYGLSYSQLINALRENDVLLNRKMLSEIAIHSPITFKKILSSIGEKLDAEIETKIVELEESPKRVATKKTLTRKTTAKKEAASTAKDATTKEKASTRRIAASAKTKTGA